MMTSIERITKMEAILEQATAAMDELEQKIDNLYKMQDDIKKLEAYYSSEEWKRDFALDEKGKLPKELKRGVLSEDAIHDLLERNKELMATVCNYKD